VRSVAIYRSSWLPRSEHFIVGQAKALRRHDFDFIGLRYAADRTAMGSLQSTVEYPNAPSRMALLDFRVRTKAPRLRTFLEQRRPALIHAQFGPDGVEVLPLAKSLNIPLVVSFHGYDATKSDAALRRGNWAERMFLWKRKQLIDYGSRFIAVSRFVAGRLERSGFPVSRTTTLYVGVDVDRFRPGNPNLVGGSILFVGRLVQNKGVATLLEAMAQISANRRPGLTVIGDGPEREPLQRQATRLGVQCSFVGALPADEVVKAMQTARAVVVPSLEIESGESEGFGLVAVEAQACGVPVIASRVGGLPEALIDGETGCLVEPGEAGALADAIDSVCGDPRWTTRRPLISEWAATTFSLARCTAALEDVYDEVGRV
jgi:colanic acid/amylovoran biosynthesis glycosyltransferase